MASSETCVRIEALGNKPVPQLEYAARSDEQAGSLSSHRLPAAAKVLLAISHARNGPFSPLGTVQWGSGEDVTVC